jgi:hypothetical protein
MAPSAAAWTAAVLAVGSLAVFVWLQFASIDTGTNKDFLLLVFSSFFFLGIATILALIVWRGPTIGQKALAVAVSTILIIGTIFVANSLTQNRRGGLNASTYVSVDDFVLNMQGYKYFDQVDYRRQYSKVIHEPSYASSRIILSTREVTEVSYLEITLLTPANVNGTCYIWFAVKPYEYNTYALLREEVVFTENSTSQVFDVDVYPMWSGGYRGKFEEYNIEFMLDLDLLGAETEPSVLNFTVTSHIEVHIQEWIVLSTFQNNLCFALCGLFIGINASVLGSFAHFLFLRRRKRKEMSGQE